MGIKQKLFTDFQEVSAKAWKQNIQYELKGADYNEKLVWESPEGIKVKPFYHADDLASQKQSSPTAHNNWLITQHIVVRELSLANKHAISAIAGGAESIRFTLPSPDTDLKALLKDIDCQSVAIHCQFESASTEDIQKLTHLLSQENSPISFHMDPIGHLAATGNWFTNMAEDFEILSQLLQVTQTPSPKNVVTVNAELYQNAGGTMVQQLAYALAHANEYLHRFGSKLESITFKMAIGGNYFFEIAKIRALRKLWKLLAAEYDITADCRIEATPSKRNKTLYDYNMNMIRTTTECMSAILGGADSICNLNYDFVYHKNNAFAERIARNQLLLLKEESYFKSMQNPAEGSYYIESLTDQLAEKALILFKDMEANGGFLKQLKYHTLQKKLRESAQKEQEKFNSQKEVLVGSNRYSSSEDRMKNQLKKPPFGTRRKEKTLIEPILESRLTEALERERLKNEGWQG
ncbi:methylmalonyl-CoA mutase subunit beta [Zobellia roscoffensis]|uniref:methylmalonyl-CoA mutase subunit beta n=1 Tax=Zobellia roscoffensis TaxID=2779508 RepID=UPI00188CAE40|nr:methylmalonyl-CoA mutase subunit beta [Zobellia roscoffensis]